jgi:tRNA pseudouridine55 synthase
MTKTRPPSAVWLVTKPVGATSFDLVKDFRTEHEGPWPLKVVHGGVLDPFAHGLVVLLVGAATRLFERLHEAPKQYVAEVQWGTETDTGDGGGAVVREAPMPPPTTWDEALLPFRGWTEQVPPATSNKRVDGERAYEKAHRGEAVTLPPSRVYLHEATWRAHDDPTRAWLSLTVRGGFYVRSLVRDVGRALGSAAHVRGLERTHLGPWAAAPTPRMVIGRDVLPWLPSEDLTDELWGRVRRGETITVSRLQQPAWPLPPGFPPAGGVRLFHQSRLVAVWSEAGTTILPGGV